MVPPFQSRHGAGTYPGQVGQLLLGQFTLTPQLPQLLAVENRGP
jgi:hypothetical protein